MNTIKTNGKYTVYEVDGLFYVVEKRPGGQITSALYSDASRCNLVLVANDCENGVKYVSTGRTRAAAMAGYRRLTSNAPKRATAADFAHLFGAH